MFCLISPQTWNSTAEMRNCLKMAPRRDNFAKLAFFIVLAIFGWGCVFLSPMKEQRYETILVLQKLYRNLVNILAHDPQCNTSLLADSPIQSGFITFGSSASGVTSAKRHSRPH